MKNILSVLFLLSASSLFSQSRDTTFQSVFLVDTLVTLTIDMQHTDLTIQVGPSDSIAIINHIKVLPNNPQVPFAGVYVSAEQDDDQNVMASISISEDIQPHNEFESICTISVPSGTHLTIDNRFGIIHLGNGLGQLSASLDYVNFYADSLSFSQEHQIVAHYSTLHIAQASILKLKGNNINFKGQTFDELQTRTQFSMIEFQKGHDLEAHSYTDRFIVDELSTLMLSGEKVNFRLNTLEDFLQCELNHGYVQINKVEADFSELNIANKNTRLKLAINEKSCFTVNADMRYCELKQEEIHLQEIISPEGKLYSGWYGKEGSTNSKLSLISSYGDVEISIE